MKRFLSSLSGGFSIQRLISGGLITNYRCPSHCRHCLYNCGSHWLDQYIKVDTAAENFEIIRRLGCRSVHIGGGEPFLRPDMLRSILTAAHEAGVDIDYIETNASWFKDEQNAMEILFTLKEAGLSALLVSISPFHNEFIPFKRTQGVMAAAEKSGIRIFPWVMDFYSDLASLDVEKPHDISEMADRFGSNYLPDISKRYWIHLGGRALNTFRPFLPSKTIDQIFNASPGTCRRELSDTAHFHLDLFGNYIPGLCSGLAIKADDLGPPLDKADYPVLASLVESGIIGLYKMAKDRYGFQPGRSGYIGKCDLCYDIRNFLIKLHSVKFIELAPKPFYQSFVKS